MDIKKKENKVMEELVLLEEAAQKYKLEPGEQFGAWFWDMERLSEHESYILSCQLEPGPRWPAEHARPGTSGTTWSASSTSPAHVNEVQTLAFLTELRKRAVSSAYCVQEKGEGPAPSLATEGHPRVPFPHGTGSFRCRKPGPGAHTPLTTPGT
ncbi:uncharacterized protein LOC109444547 isoform X1 [Rhinolophus sinicus]|uniref:uncharacterized protein LOC109444547 isoform X1 n=1 Tax=Rhinolophus sinicus TaxID=89399 RepID=UPI003D79003C